MSIDEFKALQKKVEKLDALTEECKIIQSIIHARMKEFEADHRENSLDASFVGLGEDLNEAIADVFTDYKRLYVEVLEKY